MMKTSNNATKQDLSDLKEALRSDINGFKDEVMSGLDAVMKELETMRDENTLGVGQTRELYQRVDNHEKRIKKLETS